MSYHYGSNSPEIPNPFKVEGLLYLCGGLIIFILGVLSLLNLRGEIIEVGLAAGWLHLLTSLVLVTIGVTFIFKGFNKRSRFYVGRGAPSSLSVNKARGETQSVEKNAFYASNQIEQMLVGRKNPTFYEPVTLFDRMIYSLNPKFIFLPYTMRNYLHMLVRNAGYSFIGLAVYLIALLSGSVGLTLLTESSFSDWLGIVLCLFLLVIWFRKPISQKRVTAKQLYTGKNSNIAWVIALALLVPSFAELLLRQGVEFPNALFNPTWMLVVFYVMIVLVSGVGITLAYLRADLSHPTTEVSEYKDHWEENVHPRDFFRALEMEMANLRYREIPNRVYRVLKPNLEMEGSMDKGSFVGDAIQETQPIYKDMNYTGLLKSIRFYASIGGQLLMVLASLLLFFNKSTTGFSLDVLVPTLIFPLILFSFASFLLTISNIYWGEIQFESYLIQFRGEGTYTESKLRTGKSIMDSTESENTFVRTSFSPWVLMTQIVSSTHAKSGANAFGHARYVMSLDKADEVVSGLVNKISTYLDEKEVIAFTRSNKDVQNIEALHAINESSNTEKKFEAITKSETEQLTE